MVRNDLVPADDRSAVVTGALIFIVCLVAFAGVAAVATQPGIPPIDVSMAAFLRDLGSPTLDTIMSATTRLGSTLALVAVTIVAVAALAASRQRGAARFVTVAVVASFVANTVLKLVFQRPRPGSEVADALAIDSFPSGHAMNSFVVYVAIALVVWQLWGRRAGMAAVMLAITATIVVGISRVYLGVHWLTDVVGGYLAGAMCLLIVMGAFVVADRSRGATASARRSAARSGGP